MSSDEHLTETHQHESPVSSSPDQSSAALDEESTEKPQQISPAESSLAVDEHSTEKGQYVSGSQSSPVTIKKDQNGSRAQSFQAQSPPFLRGFMKMCVAFLGLCAVHWLVLQWQGRKTGFASYTSGTVDWISRREEVKQAFTKSWDSYAEHAWGYDIYHPISKRGSQMSPKGLGWMIVDGLDSLMIMGLTDRLGDARRWISRSLDYNQDQDVNTFETTIRMLGGLLSAHYLSKVLPGTSSKRDYVYLQKSVDLAGRLLGAYESPSGIPCASIHLADGRGIVSHEDGGASSTAEAATLQLEMKYLSNITGKDIYWRKAERVMKVVDDNRAEAGLVPIYIDPGTGQFVFREIRLGSRGDSYYEYLIKQYHQTSESIYLDMWDEAINGIEKHLVSHTRDANLQFVAELPIGIGGRLSPKMDHLVCFLPGSIALGVTGGLTEREAKKQNTWTADKARQMRLARELTKTCFGMYRTTATGLAPEIIWFNTHERALIPQPGDRDHPPVNNDRSAWTKDYVIKLADAHNLQRPETVESLFMMWRITEDPIYRHWGWEIFQAFQKHTLTDDGTSYTSLDDVTKVPPPKRDNMESFWLAETLKYFYLLFSPVDLLPLTDVVFNTEAHVFPRMGLGKFSTGWERQAR